MDGAIKDPTVIQNIKTTIDSIPGIIRTDGHKKISRMMIFYWGLHFIATAIMTTFVILDKENQNSQLVGTLMVILQLMISKIFESSNKMYDNCMRIQSNVADINITILGLIRDYHCLLNKGIHNNERSKERLTKLNDRVVENLQAYKRNMHILTLFVNSFFWKSPEYTPFLEKDAIRDNFITILNDFQKEVAGCCTENRVLQKVHSSNVSIDTVSF